MINKSERIFGLDLMRCVAILFVLLSHSRFFIPIAGQKSITVFGFLGVELFFVLSGFLIGGILIKTFEKEASASSLKVFWVRRWLRTLPNYYFFILVNIIIVLTIAPPRITLEHLSWYFVFLQNFAWVKPSFFNVSWSLCVEEWFYMFYPLAVLMFRYGFKFSVKKSFLSATILFIIFPIAFRIYCFPIQHMDFRDARMMVVSRLDAMMTGVFIAFLKFYYREKYDKLTKPGAIIGALMSIALFIYYISADIDGRNGWAQVFYLTFCTIAFALFLPACDKLRTSSTNIIYTAIYKTSLWSYSLYLINFPIGYLLTYIKKTYALNSGWFSLMFLAVFYLLSFFLASVLYKYLEKPFLSLRDKFFKEDKVPAAVTS